MADLQMDNNNLNRHANEPVSQQQQSEKMKQSKGLQKNIVLIGIITVVILLCVSGLNLVIGNIGGILGSDQTEQEEKGTMRVNDAEEFATVDVSIPKPKPEPKVIEKAPEPVQNVQSQSDFLALMNKNNSAPSAPSFVTKESYDVLKANKGSMLKVNTNIKAFEEEERIKKEEQAKKEAEELAKKEAQMYPYGYTYRFINGISVKVPNTRPVSLYDNRYSVRGNSASALGNSVFQARASALKMDLNTNFLLPKGTFIPCSLDTRILTDLAGGVNCTIRDDVYSADGKVLLIEKGSQVYGFFENGQIKVGMDRVFVIWQEIRTPAGIAIPIDSFATDELGSSGAVGQIDYHWALRFTSSILVSVMSDAFANLNTRLAGDGGGGSNSTYDNTKQTSETLATETLKRFIDIEPTLLKHHGELIGIYVNKDIDFSDVYELDLAD